MEVEEEMEIDSFVDVRRKGRFDERMGWVRRLVYLGGNGGNGTGMSKQLELA